MPDASWGYLSTSLEKIDFLHWSVIEAGFCLLCVFCLLWLQGGGRHFSGTPLNHKASSQINIVCPASLSVPPGWLSPPDFHLCPSPPHTHTHPSPISWKETFIRQDDSQQTCTLASVVINCNVFRFVVLSKHQSVVVSELECSLY